jgi:hypothetical protein
MKGVTARRCALPQWSRGLGNEIVIGVTNNLHSGKLSDRQSSTNVDATVDVGSIRFPASDQIASAQVGGMSIFGANQPVLPGTDTSAFQVFSIGLAFYKDIEGASDK